MNLTERLRDAAETFDPWDTPVPYPKLMREAADAIEYLKGAWERRNDIILSQDAEIKKLKALLSEYKDAEHRAVSSQGEIMRENRKLQRVVDAAKEARTADELGLLSIEKGWRLDEAIADLEEE